jgi:hypothetical protein
MIIFIDYKNFIIYILAPKCGSQSIASYLNLDLHMCYCIDEQIKCLKSNDFKKIIIYRKNILSRFLSGFYEDLFNNTCYDKLDITFDNYLQLLNDIFINKYSNINILKYDNKESPIWFGNCSNVSLPITDLSGNFISHIISQKYAISNIIDFISDDNVEICELNNLNKITGYIHSNQKIKTHFQNIGEIQLSEIKKNKIIITSQSLTQNQINIINNIYEEDIIFINNLEIKYKNVK